MRHDHYVPASDVVRPRRKDQVQLRTSKSEAFHQTIHESLSRLARGQGYIVPLQDSTGHTAEFHQGKLLANAVVRAW